MTVKCTRTNINVNTKALWSENTISTVAHTNTHTFKDSAPQPPHQTISPGILERSRDPYRAELAVSGEHQ